MACRAAPLRPFFFALGAALAITLALLLGACEEITVVPVEAETLAVDPGEGTLAVGGRLRFSAVVRDASGNRLTGRAVEWTVTDPAVASVDPEGWAQGSAPGSTRIDARVGRLSASALLQVEALPATQLIPDGVVLEGISRQGDAVAVEVAVRNAGGGTLAGLSASVEADPEAPGDVDGQTPERWLAASLSRTTAPAALTLIATASDLTPGAYRARVVVRADGDPSGAGVPGPEPVILPVTFQVAAPPGIGASPDSLEITMTEGDGPPLLRTVAVTNLGGGRLTGMQAEVGHPSPPPVPWLQATLAGTEAPTELQVAIDPTGLAPGLFPGWVDLTSPDAAGDPMRVPIRLTVTEAAPRLTLAADSAVLTVRERNPVPASTTVEVGRTGSGRLGGLTATVRTSPGAPEGWLQATLEGPVAPTLLQLEARAGSLAPGAYLAVVDLASPDAAGSPVSLPVRLQVLPGPSDRTSVVSVTPDRLPADGNATALVTVELRDAQGLPLPDSETPVILRTSLGLLVGANLGAGTTTVASPLGSGRYQAILQAGEQAGTAVIRATAGGLPLQDSATVSLVANGTGGIQVEAGVEQTGEVGLSLADSLVVRVVDAGGAPRSGETVLFQVVEAPAGASGSGLAPPSRVSDSQGRAATTFTLGSRPGRYAVEARLQDEAAGSGVRFEATARVGPASAGSSETAVGEDRLPADGASSTLVTVLLRDRFGNPRSRGGDEVQVRTSAGSLSQGEDGAAGGSDTPVRAADQGDGRYTVILVADSLPEEASVAATLGPQEEVIGEPVTVTFLEGGSATVSTVAGGGQTGEVGRRLPEPLVIRVLDGFGNPAAGTSVALRLVRTPVESSGAGLTNPDPVTDGVGEARTFLDLGNRPGEYEVEVRIPGVGPGEGPRFLALAVPGPASPLTSTLTVAETEVVADGTASTVITATVRDRFGNGVDRGGDLIRITTTGGTLADGAEGAGGGPGTPVEAADQGDGRHTLTLTAPEAPGEATLTAILGDGPGDPLSATTTVRFVSPANPVAIPVTHAGGTPLAANSPSPSVVEDPCVGAAAEGKKRIQHEGDPDPAPVNHRDVHREGGAGA